MPWSDMNHISDITNRIWDTDGNSNLGGPPIHEEGETGYP